MSRAPEPVYKAQKSKPQRFLRIIGSFFDPRAWAHGVKLLNYYNNTHVAELRQARIGRSVSISPTASFSNARNIVLGDRVRIGANSSLWAGPGVARIVLGTNTLLAPNVMLTTANYRFNDGGPVNDQAMDEADIIIGEDVWIGYGAVVLAGVTIGDRAIIGAGAVVRDDVPRNGILVGGATTVVGYRSETIVGEPEASPQSIEPNPAVAMLVGQELQGLEEGDLDRPLRNIKIDSFDLITLRTAIETECRVRIPDQEWAGLQTLGEIARLPALAEVSRAPKAVETSQPAPVFPSPGLFAPPVERGRAATIPGRARREYNLNMPQMALSGLGEAWMFKEIGDLHWQMITDFLQSSSSEIADDTGARLYATFTRFQLEAMPDLSGFRENDPLTIDSDLERFGASFFFGRHEVASGRARCAIRTMSTFAKYGEKGENTSLIKGTPTLPDPDALPSLVEFPEFGSEYRTRRGEEAAPEIFSCEYEILAPHDVNGVGLLYFAAYPSIFDICIERYEGTGFLTKHSTVKKDIFYYANSEVTDTLVFRLHERLTEGKQIVHSAALFRKSDGKRMGEVVSVKRPVEV